MSVNIKQYAEETLKGARDRYILDLEALSHEQLANRPAEGIRSVYDFTYEIVIVNQRFLMRLRREEPPALADGWIDAPAEFCDKEKAISEFRKSVDDVLALVEPYTEEEYSGEFPLREDSWTVFRAVCFLAHHVNYHDGQLNYIQALGGDSEVHWH